MLEVFTRGHGQDLNRTDKRLLVDGPALVSLVLRLLQQLLCLACQRRAPL